MTTWRKAEKGVAELRTNVLTLIVRQLDSGRWECVVYNTGQYKALGRFPHLITGGIEDAQRVCLGLARQVLSDELAALG